MSKAVNHPKIRRFKLNVETLETLDDVKKILDLLNIRIQTDNPVWEEVGQFFNVECVPKGYMKLREKIGDEEIAKLHYYEIEQQSLKLLSEDQK
tara:strand:+ start:2010 stop:2291 length:282 start_codon:yes stop_codon:yes gene_type:complete